MCENSARNMTASFRGFHGSVDEVVVLWDVTAINRTSFYGLSLVLKTSSLCSAEIRL